MNSEPDLDLRLAHAALAHRRGLLDEAEREYAAILELEPGHIGALIQYAALLRETDRHQEAARAYRDVLSLQPHNSRAHTDLGNALWNLADEAGARRHYEAAIAIDPGCAPAHRGLAGVFSELREAQAALEHGKKGYAGSSHYSLPHSGSGPAPCVLVLYTAARGNTPLERAIDDKLFRHTALIVDFHDPGAALPPHDLAFNAIGDAEHCTRALRLAAELLKKTGAPVINAPEAVAKTSRAGNARRLAGIEGLVVPAVLELSRETLEGEGAPALLASKGFGFPLLLRAQGFQGGKHFVKADSHEALAAALKAMPGGDFVVIQFVDARGADGETRKYRVMMIDGGLYPLHAAISKNWKIHYFSADMKGNAAHRAEDEAFLTDMPKALGAKAMAALKQVQATLGLDYAGIDFSLDAAGAVVFYEANATMAIAPAAAGEKWDYRRGPIQKAVDAVTAMLRSRMGDGEGATKQEKNPADQGYNAGLFVRPSSKDPDRGTVHTETAGPRMTSGLSGVDVRLARAVVMHNLGRLTEAKMEYVAILKQEPDHLGALAQYALLQHGANRLDDAMAVYGRIIALRPRNLNALWNLGHMHLARENYGAARNYYEAAIAVDPECTEAHQGMTIILSELRESEAAFEHGKKGYKGRVYQKLPYLGSGRPPTVLGLYTTARGNTPLDTTIDPKVFQHIKLAAEFHNPTVPLLPHDVAWNAIGDAELCAQELKIAGELLKNTRVRVINAPEAVAKTSRAGNARRLAGIEGLVVPAVLELSRETLEGEGAPALLASKGFGFPLLLRAQGFQGGKHFVKADSHEALAAALKAMPGGDFVVIQFVDARGADGETRKYRVMMIDGGLYPLHAAISKNWKIHYFSADMKGNAAHRAEDEAFLTDMPKALGAKAMAALKQVQATLGLDYAGIDFSLDAAGAVVFYEANATMTIAPAAAGEKWDYRRGPIQKAVDAVTAMLHSRIQAKP